MTLLAKQISTGSILLSLEKISQIFLGIIFGAIAFRYFGPLQYGILTLATSIVAIASIATGNFEVFLYRYGAEYQQKGQNKTIRFAYLGVQAFQIGSSIVVAFGLWILAGWVALIYKQPLLNPLLKTLGVCLIFGQVDLASYYSLFGLQRFSTMAVLTFCVYLTKLILVIITSIQKLDLTVFVIMLAVVTVISAVVSSICAWIAICKVKGNEFTVQKHLVKRMFTYCLPLLGARGFQFAEDNLGTMILGWFFSPVIVGYFGFIMVPFERLTMLSQTISSSLLSSFVKFHVNDNDDKNRELLISSFNIISLIAFLTSLIIVGFSREITLILGGSEYLIIQFPLQIIAFATLFRIATQPLTMFMYAREQTKSVAFLAGIRFTVRMLMYGLLMAFLGIEGVVIAIGVTYFITFIISVRVVTQKWSAYRENFFSRLIRCALLIIILGSVAVFINNSLSSLWISVAVKVFVLMFLTINLLIFTNLVAEKEIETFLKIDLIFGPIQKLWIYMLNQLNIYRNWLVLAKRAAKG